MGKQITIDEEQLDSLIAAKVKAASADTGGAATAAAEAIKQVFGISQDGNTIEQRIHTQLGTPIPARECLRTMHQACVNPRNGASFTAVIVPSRVWKEGRVVNLIDYQYPEDLAERAIKAGKPIHRQQFGGGDPRHGKMGLTETFLQWRYETYDQADRKAFVGESPSLLPVAKREDGTPVSAVEWKPESTARHVGAAQIG